MFFGRHHDHDDEELPRPPRRGLHCAFASFAMQDWLVALYVVAMACAVALGDGPRRGTAARGVALDALVFAGVVASRGNFIRSRLVAGLLYRAGLIGTVVLSFFQLQHLHATARHVTYDAALFALDLRFVGFEPAIAWEVFATPATTEWFASFYFGYFLVVCAYTLPLLLFERRMEILSEMSAGILFVVCVGHTIYLLVPGQGPYVHLATSFERELEGAVFWPLVQATVGLGEESARRDIFPSLHTALPTLLTIASFLNRRARPFGLLWVPMALVTSQIVIATMFLRWHYLVDVVAGLLLAAVAAAGARAMVPAEARSRRQFGVAPVWRPLFGPRLRIHSARRGSDGGGES